MKHDDKNKINQSTKIKKSEKIIKTDRSWLEEDFETRVGGWLLDFEAARVDAHIEELKVDDVAEALSQYAEFDLFRVDFNAAPQLERLAIQR